MGGQSGAGGGAGGWGGGQGFGGGAGGFRGGYGGGYGRPAPKLGYGGGWGAQAGGNMGGGMGGPLQNYGGWAQAGGNMAPPPVDHAANFQQLYAQNPQLANEYRTRSGDTLNWWQNGGQAQALQGQFGGDQGAMNQWINSTSGQGGAQNGAITGQQTAQLNSMAGVRPPEWAINAYRQARATGQPVNPTYEPFV